MNLRSANWQRSREYCKIVFAFEVQQIEFPSRTNRNWLDFEQKIKEPGQFWAYELTWTSTEVLVVQAALSEARAGLLLLQLQQLLLLPLLNTTVCAWVLTWSATEVLVVRAAVSEVGAGLVAVAGFAQGLLHHAPTWPGYYGWDSSHCHILCHGVMEQVSWCHAMSHDLSHLWGQHSPAVLQRLWVSAEVTAGSVVWWWTWWLWSWSWWTWWWWWPVLVTTFPSITPETNRTCMRHQSEKGIR